MPSACRAAAPLLFALACACSSNSDTSSGSGGGGGAGGGSSTASGNEACPEVGACIDETCENVSSPTGEYPCQFQCEQTALCDTVRFVGDSGASKPFELDNPEALTCVFDALAAGDVGFVHWTASDANDIFVISTTLHVLPNRVAVANRLELFDNVTNTNRRGPSELREGAYFNGCKAEQNPNLAFDCLSDWQETCGVAER